MKSTNYSKKVMEHFREPHNVGVLEGDDVAMGRVGNPVCGDLMEIYIRVKEKEVGGQKAEVIDDIKFRTFGCGSAIATSSMVTEIAKGKTLDDALLITRKDVAEELDGLPPIKMHCSNLAADALHAAIRNWRGEESGESDDTREARQSLELRQLKGEDEFLNKGYYVFVDDPGKFEGKRVLVIYRGQKSIELALELTKYTGRVVLAYLTREVRAPPELKKKLERSDVKILHDAEVIELIGDGELEKVKIHDLDEDEDYELFVDAVISLALDSTSPGGCAV
ncbi:MAG: iron-sulfur cluster assembly scaffold protein [Promethearchaeota archaeon]